MHYTKVTEVNLSAFVYSLFHEHFSSIDESLQPVSNVLSVMKQNFKQIQAKITSETCVLYEH